jgi:hypothetical protein
MEPSEFWTQWFLALKLPVSKHEALGCKHVKIKAYFVWKYGYANDIYNLH